MDHRRLNSIELVVNETLSRRPNRTVFHTRSIPASQAGEPLRHLPSNAKPRYSLSPSPLAICAAGTMQRLLFTGIRSVTHAARACIAEVNFPLSDRVITRNSAERYRPSLSKPRKHDTLVLLMAGGSHCRPNLPANAVLILPRLSGQPGIRMSSLSIAAKS